MTYASVRALRSATWLTLALVLGACPMGSDEGDGISIDARMKLGDQLAITLEPSEGEGYGFSLEVPPQNGERYAAELTLRPSDSDRLYRARLTTSCSEHSGGADEVSSENASDGAITFRWSAQYSSQFVQIVSDEPEPFDLQIELLESNWY